MSGAKPSPITRPGLTARLGETIAGRYELVRVLGSGGMGVVYEARHTYTGKTSALKLLHPRVAGSPEGVKRFLREAQAQSSIGHPGIVEVLDAGVAEDGSLYLVFELLDGHDLGKRMGEQPLSIAELVDVSLQILDALEVAHQKGFVHRDIKPENVFLLAGEGLRAKLLDFGIAKRIGNEEEQRLTTTGAAIGTPVYMSPEQARGVAVDARTDLWSMGALLFRALTGRPPFQAENYNALVLKIATEPVPRISELRPDIPAELAAVLDRALVRELEQRWGSAREMADALRAMNANEPAKTISSPVPAMPSLPERTLGEAALSEVSQTIAATPSRWVVKAAIITPIVLMAIAVAVLLMRETKPAPVISTPPAPVPETVAAPPAKPEPEPEREREPVVVKEEPPPPPKAKVAKPKKRAVPAVETPAKPPPPVEEPKPAKKKYEPLRTFDE